MTDIGQKLTAANDDLRARFDSEHERNTSALLRRLHRVTVVDTYPHCTGPCDQGRKFCPSPQACQTPVTEQADTIADSVDAVWFFGALAVALVIAAYLWSGGAVDIAMWLRGLV